MRWHVFVGVDAVRGYIERFWLPSAVATEIFTEAELGAWYDEESVEHTRIRETLKSHAATVVCKHNDVWSPMGSAFQAPDTGLPGLIERVMLCCLQ